MIKKITYVGVITLLISSLVSCEKDYTEVGASIINNSKFSDNEMNFDVKMSSVNIPKVQTDNISIPYKECLLGIYNPDNYKHLNASIVTQVGYPGEYKALKSSEDDVVVLDKVIIKLPYPATKQSDGSFELDSIIGDKTINMTVKVFENKSYLNTLNPKDPSKKNTYNSNHTYTKGENLTENSALKFTPKKTDTSYPFQRTKMIEKIPEYYSDKIKISGEKDEKSRPFLMIPLDKSKMKTKFWDKLDGAEFASSNAFQDYFKGLIIEVEGNNGSLIPFNFVYIKPKLEFYYTVTRFENKKYKDTVDGIYSFPLSGIRSNIYKMGQAKTTPSNSVAIQGTAGSMSKINIITNEQLEDIRSKNVLINDASLTFYVNQNIDKNIKLVPQRLLLYRELKEKGIITPVHISDIYTQSEFYGGFLENKDKLPLKYTFHITDYLVNLVNGKKDNMPLILKAHNISPEYITKTVRTNNSNPRGVTLYDGSLVNGQNRAQLKISYSKEQ